MSFRPPQTLHKNDPLTLQTQHAAKSLALCSEEIARARIDFELAERLQVLPLSFDRSKKSEHLRVAISDSNNDNLDGLRFAVGCQVIPVTVPADVLKVAVFLAYKGSDATLEAGLSRLKQLPNGATKRDDLPKSTAPAPTAVDAIIEHAAARGASDIHLVPTVAGLTVRLRLGGELLQREEAICSPEQAKRLVARIKVLARLDTTIQGIQEGRFTLTLPAYSMHVRVSVMPTFFGER